MKTSRVVLRFFRIISLLAFVVVLFSCYAQLPLEVAVHYDEVGVADQFVNKSYIFYGLAIFVVLLNTSVSVLAGFVSSLPLTRLQLPNRQFWLEHRDTVRAILSGWLSSLASVINFFLILSLIVVLLVNSSDEARISQYAWLLGIGGLILAGWLAYLPIRFTIKTAHTEED